MLLEAEGLPQVPLEPEPGSYVLSRLPRPEIILVNTYWTLHSFELLYGSRHSQKKQTKKKYFSVFLRRILNVEATKILIETRPQGS